MHDAPAPLDEVDEVVPDDEPEELDEEEVDGPSPFVVVVQATNKRREPSAIVDFMEGRLPC